MAGLVGVSALAVVAAATLSDDVRVWVSLTAMGMIVAMYVVVWLRRPRPADAGWISPREQRDLAAIGSGERIETTARRDVALDRARRGVHTGLALVPVYAMQAVLWGSYSWSPLWLRAGVLPLVVVGEIYALRRLAGRMRVIDHYDDTIPPGAPSGETGEVPDRQRGS